MVNKFITALALVIGLAGGAAAQQGTTTQKLGAAVAKLFTVTPIDEDNLPQSAIDCYKSGGKGIVIYKLDEDGSGEPESVACLNAVTVQDAKALKASN